MPRETADRIVRNALIPVGQALVGLFLLFTIVNAVVLEAPARVPMAATAFITALVLAAMVRWVRRTGEHRHAHAVAAVAVGMAVLNTVLRIALTGDAAYTNLIALSILGVGLVFLDLRWALGTILGCLAVGAGVVTSLLGGETLGLYTFTVAGATMLSFALLTIRRRLYWRLERLRSETEAKAAELELSERRYQLALLGSSDGLYDWDLATNDIVLSDRMLEVLGFPTGDDAPVTSTTLFDHIHPDDVERVRTQLIRHLKDETPFFEDEFRLRRRDASYVWVLVRGASDRDPSGRALRIAGSVTDMSRRGVFDPLTGLPNRRLLVDRLKRVLVRRNPDFDEDEGSALLFIDLDGFKLINDTLGHQAGDDLLKMAATRLQACVRASDTVARLGGDEFVVLLNKVRIPSGVDTTLERVTERLHENYELDGRSLQVLPSIGVVMTTEGYDDPATLLRDADSAMYQAKQSEEAVIVFDVQMRDRLASRLDLEMDLKLALNREEFVLHFQQIVSLDDGSVEGFEALVRWQHPERGLVPPGEFIQVMEETGLIVPLGNWVIRRACEEMGSAFGGLPLEEVPYVSVNLSGRHLAREDLVPTINTILLDTAFPPSRLRLELTESAIIDNPRRAAARLAQLREAGIHILMDDFGTGHSSLSYLQTLPIDTLKIDRSFIHRMSQDDEGTELVHTIVRMAHNLGLAVVAEGIETPDQVSLLKEMECASGQGFLFAHPRPLAREASPCAGETVSSGAE